MFKQLPTIINDLNKLGISLKSLDAMNIGTVGLNIGNIQAYQSAIKGLSAEQAVFALVTKGANAAQIEEIMTTETATLAKGTYTQADVQAALAKHGLATASTILTVEQQKEITNSGLLSAEKMAEIASVLGLTTAENGSLVSKKALNAEMVKQQLESIGIVGATQAQIMSMLGLATAEIGAVTGTNLLTASFAKLWAVISAHPIGALITAVGALAVGVVSAVNASNKAKEDVRQAAIELTNTYTQEIDSLDSQIEKYKELKETLDSGNLSTNEVRSIKEQLLSIQESLIESYGNEASNIDLVNGKYKEQLGLLSELSKEKATEYVTENRDVFADAKEALEKARNFELGTVTSWSSYAPKTEDQEKLLDFIEAYSDLLELTPVGASHGGMYTTAMTLSVKANTEDADELMHQFATDLEKYGKENDIDVSGILEGISEQLKKTWTDELTEYKTVYDEFMKAEIVRNDTLRPLYQQSIQAVEDYNNALSSGEGVAEAKANLDSVQQSVQNATSELDGSQEVFDGIYDGINKNAESAYNLSQAFENDETVKGYAEQLKGLTDIDLKAINFEDNVKSPGEKAFGALIDILGLSEEEIQNLIDKLVELGYVQGEVQGSMSDETTDNLFSYDKLEDIPQKLSEIESAYQTAQEALDSFNEKGYYSMDVIDSILSLEDEYINVLVDENGQLQINSDSMNQLAAIKIEAAKASIYQETCEELVRIKTLDTSLAAQELALINGTLTESAYETAKALYEEVTAMGGANAALADNVWNAATKKVKLLDNQLASIQDKTYSVDVSLKATSSSSSSTSSDPLKDAFTQEYNTLKHNLEMDYITEKQYYDSLAALNRKYFAGKEEYLDEYRQYEEEVYKGLKSYYTDYAESQMDLLESQLDAGIINYAHYSSTIKSLLDNMYADSRLSAEDYHKYIQQMLNKQLDIYDKVLSAVTSRIEKEIDGIEDIIDSIEKQNDTLENQLDNYDSILSVIDSVYEAEIDRIKAEQDAIQENIDALQDENDQRELALKLEEARWALYKAQNQRTKKIFNGTEFVYETDQAAVREAQESLADLELEQVVDGLEMEKDALDDTISELEKYRDLWAEITDVYEKEANEQLIIALYGKDYQKIILRNQLGDIEAFKNNYVSIQNQINDNEGLIASYKEKTEYYEALKQQWSDISDAYENSMESQYAAMILGQNWESDVLNGRLDTLNRFKNQYVSLQQQIADAAIAANNAIAASNEAVKNSQISSSVSAGNSGNSGSGSSASDSPTSNNLNSSSSGSSNSPALWRIVDYSSGATLKTGLKTAAEVSSWCSANGYTIVSENANTRIAAAKKQTAAATTAAIQKAKAPATKHYASGTANAKRGLNLVGEAGTETYIDNGGNVSLVTKPALIPMEGGETVIKASETEKILSNMGNTVPSDSNEVLNKMLSELPPFNEEEFRQRVMSITPSYSSMVQIPDMFTPNYDFEAVNRDNSVKVEIGDIHLHQVQKVDTLANEIIRELPNKVLQRLGKK